MSYLIKEIRPSDLKPYIVSMRGCRVSGSNCEMEGKFGHLSLDFGEFPNIDRCVFNVKRKSGNGKTAIICGSNVAETDIASKTGQHINVTVGDKKIVDVKRPNMSTGSIEIISVQLYSESSGKSYSAKDWRSILDECVEYKHIRVVDNRLFASEGAMIRTAGINAVATNPPNVYHINNKVIRFVSSCEIVDLDLLPASIMPPTVPLYPHFDNVEPAINLGKDESDIEIINKYVPALKNIQVNPEQASNLNLIYDSNKVGFLESNIKNDGKFEKGMIVLGRNGIVSIPLPDAKYATDYILTLYAGKLKGNGKVQATIVCDDTLRRQEVVEIAYHNKRALTFMLNTGPKTSGENYSIQIARPPTSTGEIFISRALVLRSPMPSKQALEAMIKRTFDLSSVTEPGSFRVKCFENDDIMAVAKSYAVYHDNIFTDTDFEDIVGEATGTTASGMMWLNKIRNFIPKVRMHRGDNASENALLFGVPGALYPTRRIWLDEFDNDAKITESDLDILSRAEAVYSPSDSNIERLRELLPNDNLVQGHKYWPWVPPQRTPHIKDNCIVVFNRSSKTTQKILDAHKSNIPRIILIGARGAYPPFVTPMNEYMPYSIMLGALLRARCIVDMPLHQNYRSGLLDLAIAAGVPVVSTNEYIKDKSASTYVEADASTDQIFDSIQITLNEFSNTKNDMSNYNERLRDSLRSMLL